VKHATFGRVVPPSHPGIEACGGVHPALLGADSVEFLDSGSSGATLRQLYRYRPEWRHPSPEAHTAIVALMQGSAPRGGSAPASPTATA
jgi:hypothetical protein